MHTGNHSGGSRPEKQHAARLAVRYQPIDALRLDPRNPRLHSRKQVRQIANSIASFGFNVPVLIDAEQRVIAGHGRILAAKELGWSEVPAIAIEHLDAAQRRAFAIADNRLTENSAWDDRLLAEQLKELSQLRVRSQSPQRSGKAGQERESLPAVCAARPPASAIKQEECPHLGWPQELLRR